MTPGQVETTEPTTMLDKGAWPLQQRPMTESNIKTSSNPPLPWWRQFGHDDPIYRRLKGWQRLRRLSLNRLNHLRTIFHIAYAVFRSFRAHMCIQFARDPEGWPSWGSDGSYRQTQRASARTVGIEALLAKRPWMDRVDLQIYLDGFDEGELSCQYTQNQNRESR